MTYAATAFTGAGLALAATSAPLLLTSAIPIGYGVLVALVLSTLAGVASARDAFRTTTAVLLAGWVVTGVGLGEGRVVAVAMTSAVALRLWAGLPELLRPGRHGLPDLVAELVGGVAVAGLAVAISRRADALPPAAVVLALAAGGVLVLAAVLRLRADPRGQ